MLEMHKTSTCLMALQCFAYSVMLRGAEAAYPIRGQIEDAVNRLGALTFRHLRHLWSVTQLTTRPVSDDVGEPTQSL